MNNKFSKLLIREEKLQKLIQKENGVVYTKNGEVLRHFDIRRIDKLKMLVVKNPRFDISQVINELTEQNSIFIPKGANSYVASDFDGSTNHMREDKNQYSVYAIQFYVTYF